MPIDFHDTTDGQRSDGSGNQGQVFTASQTYDLSRVIISAYRSGTVTGAYLTVFAVADDKPTGSVLATSDTETTLPTTMGDLEFTFSGDDIITLASGTKYVILLNYTGSGTIYLYWAMDSEGGYANGNRTVKVGSTWYVGSQDLVFATYSEGDPPVTASGTMSFSGTASASVKTMPSGSVDGLVQFSGTAILETARWRPIALENEDNTFKDVTADAFIGDGSQLTGLPLSDYAKVDDVKKYSGFENRTDSSIAMNGSNLEITTATSYDVYFTGVGKKTVDSTLSIEITEDQDITYVYLDWDGSSVRINKGLSSWDIKNGAYVPCAIVFKDASSYIVTDERHGFNRNLEWHNWAHNTVGAMYYSGLGGTFADAAFSIDNGTIYDEDIRFAIPPQTNCRLWYRNGAAGPNAGMRVIATSTTPYRDTNADGTGILQYDDDSGTLQSVGTGEYSAQWVYASNDSAYPIYVVVGQAVGNLASVRNSTAPIINLSTAEWKLLYRVIYRNAAGTATFIEAADFRSVQTGVPTNYNPTNHSSLTGRDAAGSHPLSAITPDADYDLLTHDLTTTGDITANSLKMPLSDGLLQMVGGTITQAPYDEVIGAYLIGGT